VLVGINETEIGDDIEYDLESTLIQDFNDKIDHHEHTIY
jgi:hypothetical protein